VCIGKIQHKEACWEIDTAQGEAECCMILKTCTRVLHFSYKQALSDILNFLVIWLGEIFCSSRATANFGDQDISKCLNNLFLVVEWTDRINLAVLVTYVQCCACDQSCWQWIIFKRRHDQTITKCVYNLFLAVERICRISSAGFSNLQSVVYESVYVTFLNKFFI